MSLFKENTMFFCVLRDKSATFVHLPLEASGKQLYSEVKQLMPTEVSSKPFALMVLPASGTTTTGETLKVVDDKTDLQALINETKNATLCLSDTKDAAGSWVAPAVVNPSNIGKGPTSGPSQVPVLPRSLHDYVNGFKPSPSVS